MLTRTDVSDKLRVSIATVTGWIESGELAATDVRRDKDSRPAWRIDEDDLRRFLESRKAGRTTRQGRRQERTQTVENLI